MTRLSKRFNVALTIVLLGIFSVVMTSCGGGGIGGSEGAGRGLVLLSFHQDGMDNAPLNARLEFQFSETVEFATVSGASIQIREGDEFGQTVPGVFVSEGSSICFEPRLPGLCDLSDAGFRPDTFYRVQVLGHPEYFAVRNAQEQPLNETTTYQFRTRADQDPSLFTNPIPATAPTVTGISPADGDQACPVAPGNEIRIEFSENLHPCSITSESVTLEMYEIGDPTAFVEAPNEHESGFAVGLDTSDQTSGDPYTWGADNTQTVLPEPQVIPVILDLVQSFDSTVLHVRPVFGRFPEDALLVLQMTFDVQDLGGDALEPYVMSFTTENLQTQSATYLVENEGETPYLQGVSTARINDPASCPSRVQGFLLFAGDGDNGSTEEFPTAPEYNAPVCDLPRDFNDGTPDHFKPTQNVVLDTGGSLNLCPNTVDGSTGVVWEFASFTIGPNITVQIVGVNPAIILVQGNVTIETGGTLLLAGERGQNGNNYPQGQAKPADGGEGVAGGGQGGDSVPWNGPAYGDDGTAGAGSPEEYIEGGHGAGQGNAAGQANNYTSYPSSFAGGGGGHAVEGEDGEANTVGGSTWKGPARGQGGEVYPTGGGADELLTPSAGSGGGASGWAGQSNTTSYYYRVTGAAGGAGGGFVDITSGGSVRIYGTIDARGGRGGDGAMHYINRPRTGGAGGGSGGGVRILTPFDIDVSNGMIDTSGGPGGKGSFNASYNPVPNDGGAGGNGRIVLEDGDSIITGQTSATLIPGEGAPGFYRGAFDATRFQGGGTVPVAISDIFQVGPFDPQFVPPEQTYGGTEDFIAGIPDITAGFPGDTRILVEAQGYEMLRSGEPASTPAVGWHTVGYFVSSGVAHLPNFVPNQVAPLLRPTDNVGFGLTQLNGCEYIQIRITFFLPPTAGPLDPGPYLDDWTIRFTYDQ